MMKRSSAAIGLRRRIIASSGGSAKRKRSSSYLASIYPLRGTYAKRLGTNGIKARWLALHGAAEAGFAKALGKVFRGVAASVRTSLVALARSGKLTAGAARAAVGSMKAKILAAAKPIVKKLVRAGAVYELGLFLPGRRAFTYLLQHKADPARIKLPPAVAAAVDDHAKDILKQPYWTDVGEGVREALGNAVASSQHQGESNDGLAKRIEDILGDDGSAARAMRIARTETTSALNYGQDAAREYLAEEGLIKGKQWLAILDNVTREDHDEANGQQVGLDEQFEVGGERCDHPGDFSLSAAQRVNCRCTTVSVDKDA